MCSTTLVSQCYRGRLRAIMAVYLLTDKLVGRVVEVNLQHAEI